MKKLLALVLTMMMVLSLAACGGNDGGSKKAEVDLSKYPADLSDWSAQDLLDYFKEAVGLPDSLTEMYSDPESWLSTPVHDSSRGWTDDGSAHLVFYTFDPDASDTTPELVEEWLEVLRTDSTHSYITDEYYIGPASHLAGNILFVYEQTTDENYYNACEAAYEQLISAFGVTPDF